MEKYKIRSLTDPDQGTAQLRLLKIYRSQRQERGFGNTSPEDLITEVDIFLRLVAAQEMMAINMLGEEVRQSIERQEDKL